MESGTVPCPVAAPGPPRGATYSMFDLSALPPGVFPRSVLGKAVAYVTDKSRQAPYLLIDRDRIAANVKVIGRNIPGAQVFFAVKANPDPGVLRHLAELGSGFEIASEGELNVLRELGVSSERIISSNPVKSPAFLSAAVAYGVTTFAFDSVAEADKLAVHAPACRVVVRLAVPNEGSEWPLSRKFGVETEEAVALLEYAAAKGLEAAGITFHVGSQCTREYNWEGALTKAARLWSLAEQKGLRLSVLNLGGGYPVAYTRPVVDVPTIEERIAGIVGRDFPPGIQVHMEPGRSVVGDAGVFVSSVIGKAERSGGERWLYLDVGVFNGLMEAVGGIRYHYVVEDPGPVGRWTVAGPSCDSFDVIEEGARLPESRVGARVLILSSGAYTVSYASEFNGFAVPETILI